MASTTAYEQPSISRAWDGVKDHIPTIFVVWFIAGLLWGIGYLINLIFIGFASNTYDSFGSSLLMISGSLASLPLYILSSLVGIMLSAIPAIYYESGQVVTVQGAFSELMKRPLRYLAAGILFSVALTIGFLFCILPGIAIAFVTPVYVNRVFVTDQSILGAFGSSFQSVYRSPNGMSFVGIQLLSAIFVAIVTVCTCGLGGFVAIPILLFYIQNLAYNKGVIS